MLQLPINFGLIIAYFLPGVVVTYSLRYISPQIDHLLRTIEAGQVVLGPAAILVIGAVVAGLIVSSARVVIFEPLLRRTGVPEPQVRYDKLSSAQKWKAYIQIVDNIYRFYQFYGNILLALLLLAILKYFIGGARIFSSLRAATLFIITIGSIVTLFIAARSSMCQLCDAIHDLCQ